MIGAEETDGDSGIEIGDARFLPGREPIPSANPEALPPSWWGSRRPRPPVRHLPDLVAAGMLSAEYAALLWLVVEAGASLVVCSGPSGVGKSTLLTALLACLPEERALRFALGPVDPLRRDPDRLPHEFAIAIAEISPHLPAYVWGPGLGRLVERRRAGAQLLATAHATDPADFVRQVTVYPNDLTTEQVARFDLLLFLSPNERGELAQARPDGARCRSRDPPLHSGLAGPAAGRRSWRECMRHIPFHICYQSGPNG